jgi:hypothetical protein
MRERSKGYFLLIASMLAAAVFLPGCKATTEPPALSSWSEQISQSRELLGEEADDFLLFEAVAYPIRSAEDAPDGIVELDVTLVFRNPTPAMTGGGYATRIISFHDYHLASTIRMGREIPAIDGVRNPVSIDGIALSAQDALQITIRDGERFMGVAVDGGNIEIHLVGLKNAPAELLALWSRDESVANHLVWEILYLKKGSGLTFWVDSRTGAILKNQAGPHN